MYLNDRFVIWGCAAGIYPASQPQAAWQAVLGVALKTGQVLYSPDLQSPWP